MFSVVKEVGSSNCSKVAKLVADEASDVQYLPHISDGLIAGSECFVIDPPSKYMLGHDDVWHCIYVVPEGSLPESTP